MASLIDVIRLIAGQRGAGSDAIAGGSPSSLVRQATVMSLHPDGTVYVAVDNAPGVAKASRATDEPLRVGYRVWAAETDRGILILGGVR